MPDPEHLLIEYSNKQMPLLLGFQNGAQTPGQLKNAGDTDAAYFADAFSGVHPDDLAAVKEAYRKGYALERFSIPRFRLCTASGGFIWVTVDAVLRERRPDGNVFYGTYRDITKEIALEQALDAQRKARMPDPKQREIAAGFFSRRTLLGAFAGGSRSLHLDYQRTDESGKVMVKKRNGRRGFTLMELLIVVAIIAFLHHV